MDNPETETTLSTRYRMMTNKTKQQQKCVGNNLSTGAACGACTAYPSGASELTSGF